MYVCPVCGDDDVVSEIIIGQLTGKIKCSNCCYAGQKIEFESQPNEGKNKISPASVMPQQQHSHH